VLSLAKQADADLRAVGRITGDLTYSADDNTDTVTVDADLANPKA
jgi:hypothetical protein